MNNPDETPEFLASLRKEARRADRKELLSDFDRWKNLCDALADDALDTPPPSISPEVARRIKEELTHLVKSQKGSSVKR